MQGSNSFDDPRCPTCGKSKIKAPRCSCSGGGGGGGGGSSDGSDKGSSNESGPDTNTSTQAFKPLPETGPRKDWATAISLREEKSPPSSEEIFDQLWQDGRLFINDTEDGTLVFKVDLALLSPEEQKAVHEQFSKIETEFNDFEDELINEKISVEGFTLEKVSNGTTLTLTIHIPNEQQFEAFLQRLGEKRLLPEAYLTARLEKKLAAKQPKPSAPPMEPDSNSANDESRRQEKELSRWQRQLLDPFALPRQDI